MKPEMCCLCSCSSKQGNPEKHSIQDVPWNNLQHAMGRGGDGQNAIPPNCCMLENMQTVIGISLISRSTSETFIHVFRVSEKQGGKNGERSERFRLRSDKKIFFGCCFA
jgi:hypothetical protein